MTLIFDLKSVLVLNVTMTLIFDLKSCLVLNVTMTFTFDLKISRTHLLLMANLHALFEDTICPDIV